MSDEITSVAIRAVTDFVNMLSKKDMDKLFNLTMRVHFGSQVLRNDQDSLQGQYMALLEKHLATVGIALPEQFNDRIYLYSKIQRQLSLLRDEIYVVKAQIDSAAEARRQLDERAQAAYKLLFE